ncbi:diguanylate cyclase domain-containing protein [Spirochaeta lutea]|nr:diguanylate cyclase [Spirochaeta lutea]
MNNSRPGTGPQMITDDVFWLGRWSREDFLPVNTYAVVDGSTILVIDPGPTPGIPDIAQAMDRLFEHLEIPEKIRQWQVALTGQDPGAAGGLNELIRLRGGSEKPEVYCHWRTSVLLHEPALEYRHLSRVNQNIVLPEGRRLIHILLSRSYSQGLIALVDITTGTLFSGPAMGSMGRDLPFDVDLRNQKVPRAEAGLASYTQQFSDPSWVDTLCQLSPAGDYEPQTINRVCPRYGSIWHSNPLTIRETLTVKTVTLPDKLREVAVGEGQNLNRVIQELQILQQQNFELQEDLILLQDEGIRDEATGLYNEEFFNEYLPLFVEEHPQEGTVILLHLDNLTAINSQLGYEEGNAAIRSFAHIIRSEKPETAMVFRLAGPVCGLLVPHCGVAEAAGLADTIRREVRESGAFIRPVTCSAGVIQTSQVQHRAGDPVQSLRTLGAARLESAIRQGGDKTSTGDLETADIAASEVTIRVLILESESLVARMLTTYLTNRGFQCRTEFRAETIIPEIETFKPDIILSELYHSGTDIITLYDSLESRPETSGIPVILMSHELSENVVVELHRRGIFSILRKPLILEELPGLITHLTGGVSHV